MLIRAATDADARPIAEVHVASWRAAYKGIVPDGHLADLDIFARTKQWSKNISDPSLTTLVADSDGDIVGIATFAASRDSDNITNNVGEIQAIYVHPAQWGEGIGRELCAAAVADLQSYERITLWVLRENSRARRFYERAGFQLDGTTKTITIGKPMEAVRYCTEVDRAV